MSGQKGSGFTLRREELQKLQDEATVVNMTMLMTMLADAMQFIISKDMEEVAKARAIKDKLEEMVPDIEPITLKEVVKLLLP